MTNTQKTLEELTAERDALNVALKKVRAEENKEARKKVTIKKFLNKQVAKIQEKYKGITLEEIGFLFLEEFEL